MVNHVCPMFQLDFEGLTGRIEFDDDGYRNNYKLDVYTVSLDVGPKKVKTQTRQFTFYVYLLVSKLIHIGIPRKYKQTIK